MSMSYFVLTVEMANSIANISQALTFFKEGNLHVLVTHYGLIHMDEGKLQAFMTISQH